MGLRGFLFLGLLFAIFLIASEVSTRELAETEQRDKTSGVEESKYVFGGEGRGLYGIGLRCSSCPTFCRPYGCCGCRQCCTSAAEAEAYAAAQAKAKLQN